MAIAPIERAQAELTQAQQALERARNAVLEYLASHNGIEVGVLIETVSADNALDATVVQRALLTLVQDKTVQLDNDLEALKQD